MNATYHVIESEFRYYVQMRDGDFRTIVSRPYMNYERALKQAVKLREQEGPSKSQEGSK